MKGEAQICVQTGKVVVVKARQKKADKELFFLFPAIQVEEILPKVSIRPRPFSPSFLRGICNWRDHSVPVINIEERFGFPPADKTSNDRFLVVRTAAPMNLSDEGILRCVLQVSDQIQIKNIPDSCSTVSSDEVGIETSLIRGAYQQEEDYFVIPDLTFILLNQ